MIDDPAIDVLRQRIDAIDHELMALLAKRLDVVHLVGEVKRAKSLPVFDPGREERLLLRLIQDAPARLDERAVREIFHAIVSQCRRMEGEQIEEAGRSPTGDRLAQ